MSTLTKESSSPVKVVQVLADFRLGLPRMGTVFVSARRHTVQVYRTAKGLEGKCKECSCRGGCPAMHDAMRAVEILAGAWERRPFSHVQARILPGQVYSARTIKASGEITFGSLPALFIPRKCCARGATSSARSLRGGMRMQMT